MEKKIIREIEGALFHIHALACLLENDLLEHPKTSSKRNAWSCEYLSVAQIIAEKAAFCIKGIDDDGLTR